MCTRAPLHVCIHKPAFMSVAEILGMQEGMKIALQQGAGVVGAKSGTVSQVHVSPVLVSIFEGGLGGWGMCHSRKTHWTQTDVVSSCCWAHEALGFGIFFCVNLKLISVTHICLESCSCTAKSNWNTVFEWLVRLVSDQTSRSLEVQAH